jgi:hypothetical protein
MSHDTQLLSPERAAEIWRRAAHLQDGSSAHLDGHRGGIPRASGSPDGLRMTEVRAAAADAGISPGYVDLALLELDGPDSRGLATARGERMATRVLGTERRSVEVSRAIAAPREAVLEAMKRILPAHPYSFALCGVAGEDVFVFDLSSSTNPITSAAVNLYTKQLRFVLRAGERGGCELSVMADLRRGTRQNLFVAAGFGGITGTVGALTGTLVGVGASLGAAGVLPALAGAALLGAAGALGGGALFRYFVRSLTEGLEQLLRRIDADARTRGSFPLPAAPPTRSDEMALLGLQS